MANRFQNVINQLPEGDERNRIETALNDSTISSEAALRAIIHGRTVESATSLLRELLELGLGDASALAGILVTGKYFISILSTHYIYSIIL